jgi:RNA polymerase sigma-70 factor (ECF subfamily)
MVASSETDIHRTQFTFHPRGAMNPEATLPLRTLVDTSETEEPARVPERSSVNQAGAFLTSEVSDESLLVAAGKGSKEAIGALFQRHGASVLNVAYRILHDESEAADLRQEIFLYLFQRARLYDARKASAISWIMQVTYHRAFDRRRFLTARQHYKVEELKEQTMEGCAYHLATDQLDGRRLLERFRKQLSFEQHKVLELHLFHGYSFQEIAEQSGESVGNVKHLYYRGLDQLRASLTSKKRG